MSSTMSWTSELCDARRLRAAPIMVKLGGAAIDRADEHPALFKALCDLHQEAQAEGGGVVVIHGGGAAVDRRLQRLGLVSERRDGIRITPDEHIDEVVAGLAGSVNKELVGQLQRHGAPAVGLCLGDGLLAHSRKATGYAFDPGRVGEIVGGEPRLLEVLLRDGFLPVLCSIGLDEYGEPLNINADDAAAALAGILKCRELILTTDVPGVLDATGQLIEELTADEIEQRIASGEIRGGMIPKVRGALRAAQASAAAVTIMAWSDPAALRKLGRGQCVGTRIIAPMPRPREDGASFAPAPWSDLL